MHGMRTTALGLFCCFILHLPLFGAEEKNKEGYHFSIYEKQYPLATYFDIESDDTYPGIVKKSMFRIRTNYDLSNADGWQATGIKRMLSLGTVYSWATEVDIYDTRGAYLGMIDGQVVTTAAARFSLYDQAGELRGIAYLDPSLHSYSIVYPKSEAYPIANLHYHQEAAGLSWWEATVYDEKQVDPRIVRIFTAMICDIHPEVSAYYERHEEADK